MQLTNKNKRQLCGLCRQSGKKKNRTRVSHTLRTVTGPYKEIKIRKGGERGAYIEYLKGFTDADSDEGF